MFRRRLIRFVCMSLALCSLPVHAAERWQAAELRHADIPYSLALYANHDLAGRLDAISDIVIVVHGIQRNADDYYATASALLRQSGRHADEVLLIAPKFTAAPDVAKGFQAMPLWDPQDWPAGDAAIAGTGAGISSFTAIDDLLQTLLQAGRMPSLKRIILAGHSAGAQFVQRYAVLNSLDEAIRTHGIHLQYVVANPSSFLYLSAERPLAQQTGFASYDTALCPDYNQYRYGPLQLPAYATTRDADVLWRRYLQRQVVYLAGSADKDPHHPLLDTSCAAEAQGESRLARAHHYWDYEWRQPRQVPQAHRYNEVSGVAHQQGKMFGSECSVRLLFGDDASTGPHAAACTPVQPTLPARLNIVHDSH